MNKLPTQFKIKLYTLEEGTEIFIVDGHKVRDLCDDDFVYGGHHFAYPKFIPKGEIWIEHMENPSDQKEILMHELFEWYEMKYDKKNYNDAHEFASDIENAIRQLPDYIGDTYVGGNEIGINNSPKYEKEAQIMLHSRYSHYNTLDKLARFSKDISLQEDLIDFLKDEPSPEDSQIHDFAKEKGLEPEALEEQAYSLLGDIVGKGKSVEEPADSYDKEQIQMGAKVESEHTDNFLLQNKITKDHLVEDPEYYTKLLNAGL